MRLFHWDDFYAQLLAAKNREEAMQIFSELLLQAGFSKFFYADFGNTTTKELSQSIDCLDNFPKEWMEHYFEQNYAEIDPAFEHCFKSASPMLWHKLDKVVEQETKIVRDERVEFGLKVGVTYPLHHATNTKPATLSIADDANAKEFYEFVSAHQDTLHLAGIYLHSVMQTFPKAGVTDDACPRLTNRQKEVLTWTFAHKRSKEIADILNIKTRTVNLHIGDAKKKLKASSRYEAAAKAVKLGIIQP